MTQAFKELQGTDLFSDSYGYLNDSDEALKTLFAGASAPSAADPYQLWADTASGLLKLRSADGTTWITVGRLGLTDLGHLSKDGGQMTAPGGGGVGIDMNSAPLLNLPAGSGTSAARQTEVDQKAPLASPVFATDAQLAADPPTANSLTRRSYTEASYVKKAGDSLTGALVLAADGSAALHPVTKQQQDAKFSPSSGHRHDGSDGRKVRVTDLDVAGGAAGQFPQVSGSALAFIRLGLWGSVTSAGAINGAGSGGWTVAKLGTGRYRVTFTSGFAAPPTVVATAVYAGGPASIVAVTEGIATGTFDVRTSKDDTGLLDAAFHFIALT